MKLNFKEAFSGRTDDTQYKSTVLTYIILIVYIGIVIAIFNCISISVLSRFIIVILTAIILYLTIVFFSKLSFISENIEKQKVKSKSYKFKFDSIIIEFDDLKLWLYNYSESEQIIIKVNDEFHYIEISYDTKRRRGKNINRKTYFDDIETNPEDIIRILELNSKNGKIEVFETYDHQSPKILVDEITRLK